MWMRVASDKRLVLSEQAPLRAYPTAVGLAAGQGSGSRRERVLHFISSSWDGKAGRNYRVVNRAPTPQTHRRALRRARECGRDGGDKNRLPALSGPSSCSASAEIGAEA
jgi:hypothetical protein